MARREREFAQLRDPIQHTPKPATGNSAAGSRNLASSGMSAVTGNSTGSRNREFRQQAINSRVRKTEPAAEYRPEIVVTPAEHVRPATKLGDQAAKPKPNLTEQESPTKKMKDVCVNCVNKLISNKQKMKELDKKERERQLEKQRLEEEREHILKQQMEHLRRVREEQQKMDEVLAEKRRAKEKERQNQKDGEKEIKNSLRLAQLEDQEIQRNDQQRKEEFYQTLSHQIEEQKQRRKKEDQERKAGPKPIIDDSDYQSELLKRNNQYRKELLQQIQDKQEREKRVKNDEITLEKKIVSDLTNSEYEPVIRVGASDHYQQLRKQLEEKEQLKLKKQEESRKRQQEERQHREQEEQSQNERLLQERMKQMNRYVSDLAQQASEKRERQRREKRERMEIGYAPEPELVRPEFGNCTECEVKFPRNYLSNVDI